MKAYSSGGRFGLNDDGQTPNTQATTFTYADGSIMTFEVRNLGSFEEAEAAIAATASSARRAFTSWDKGFFSYKEGKMSEREGHPRADGRRQAGARATSGSASSRPSARANRKTCPCPRSRPIYPASIASSGNIAYRLGRSLEFDPKTERFKDDEANQYLTREYRKGFEVPQLA